MAANRTLAKQRGLSDEQIERIDYIHDKIDEFTAAWIKEPFSQSRKDEIHSLEYLLQRAWGFPEDCGYHTYAKVYEFKCQWVGKVFRCNVTGKEFTIPNTVKERDFFPVGEGAVDVGRLHGYYRIVGDVIEVEDK